MKDKIGERLRLGFVGASGWMAGALMVGAEYVEGSFDPQARKGEKSPHSVVTGLCDLDRAATEKRKQDLRLDLARYFPSLEEMLAADVVDAVIVATPNYLHVEQALEVLRAEKHLFLEKPYSTSFRHAVRLNTAVESSRVTTKLDYIMLHYDEQANLQRLVRDGAFGELASIHFTYRHPIQVGQSAQQDWKLSREKSGGALPMGICHAISMTLYQADSAPTAVHCVSRPARVRNFDYDPQYDLFISFEDGVVGVVQGNIDFAESYDARHTLIGTEGQFDYFPFNPLESRVLYSSEKLERAYSPDPDFAKDHLDSGDVWAHQCSRTVSDFVGHCRAGRKDPLLGLESNLVRRTESVIWAAEASAERGGDRVGVEEFRL